MFSDLLKNADATVDLRIDLDDQQKCFHVWYEVPLKKTLSEGKNIKQNDVCKKNDWVKKVLLYLSNTGVKLSLFCFVVKIHRFTLDRTTI